MGWNYRIMRRRGTHALFGPWETFGVHEVYYDKAGRPDSWTKEPVDVGSEELAGVKWSISHMAKALRRPVLDYDSGRTIRTPKAKPATARTRAKPKPARPS